MFCTKGQIISKGLFGVLKFSQKQTNEFVVVVKTNLFVHFLGEFEDTKSPFEIIWPLKCLHISNSRTKPAELDF